MKRTAIVQSCYIPWKGYFDMIASVDEFVLYDDVQFTRRDWRNRNKIKTPQGLKWLTIPVVSKGKYEQTIRETRLDGSDWTKQHWRSLELNYRRAPHFEAVAGMLEPLYNGSYEWLTEVNTAFLAAICSELGIRTKLTSSSDYELPGDKSERLASICEQAGASTYVSGPAAKDYLDESVFAKRGIAVEWFDYSGYREYPQLWDGFEHYVSIVDLLFNCGPDSRNFMKMAS